MTKLMLWVILLPLQIPPLEIVREIVLWRQDFSFQITQMETIFTSFGAKV